MLAQNMIENIINEALNAGADFAEVFDETTFFQEVWTSQEGIEQNSLGRERGVGIRIFKGCNCYYGHTNDCSESALIRLIRSLTAGLETRNAGILRLGDQQVYRMKISPVLASGLEWKKRLEPVQQIIGAGMAYDQEIVSMRVLRTDLEQYVQIANSDGLFASDERVKTRLYIEAYAQKETDLQMGYFGPGAMAGNDYYDTIDLEQCGRETARQAKTILHAKPCPGGQMSIVVSHGFGGLLFHEACGHSLEATAIAREVSDFCGRIGQQVASDKVTLIDDGSISGEWGSLHIDDEGVPTRKNVLIENGILKNYMVDRLNGLRIGMEPTGSSRRQNYRFAPTSRMTNTYIAPGNDKKTDIIAETERGLYVKSIVGGSVETTTGDFNFRTGECYLIENGKVTEPVRGATLIGNGSTVLKNVDRVANDFELRQGYCFDASGTLYIGAGQPTIRVSNMIVGGIC